MRKPVYAILEQQRRSSACASAQSDQRLCCAGHASWIGCMSAWYVDSRGFDPLVRQHSFMKIGHEIISTTILSLPLIQEGQLSLTGKECALSTGKLPRTLAQEQCG